jgi:hypothetical protein
MQNVANKVNDKAGRRRSAPLQIFFFLNSKSREEEGHGAPCDCPPSSIKALEEQHPVHPPTVVVRSGFLSSNMLHIVDVNVNMREGIFK